MPTRIFTSGHGDFFPHHAFGGYMDVQIEGRQTSVRPEWRTDIEARVADLHPAQDITHVRVTMTKYDHKKAEDSHEVLIVVQIPGHTITARKQQDSFEEAIRDTFAALQCELEKIREKRASHEIRVSLPPNRGVVSRVMRDEGYGFIRLEDGMEVYFHRNAVHDLEFDQMEDGLEVSLNVGPGEKGLQATTVNSIPLISQLYRDKGSTA
jgi:cold shock CspA family protein/ribosome-associated translation inhibitor RaiA